MASTSTNRGVVYKGPGKVEVESIDGATKLPAPTSAVQRAVVRQLPAWIADYNTFTPHSVPEMRSSAE